VDSFEQLAGADARKVILFLAVMAVHAVGEGGGVGVSFAGDRGWAQVGTMTSSSMAGRAVCKSWAPAAGAAAAGGSTLQAMHWDGMFKQQSTCRGSVQQCVTSTSLASKHQHATSRRTPAVADAEIGTRRGLDVKCCFIAFIMCRERW
jgi:hypothetical protein